MLCPITAFAVVVLSTVAEPPTPADPQPRIGVSFDPPIYQVRPDRTDQPAKVVVAVTDAHGKSAAGAEIDLVMKAPPKPALFTTDFPIVEDTVLLKLSGRADADGKLAFDYVFPIRGRYALDVTAVVGGGAKATLALNLEISENPEEWAHLAILLAGLVAVGAAAGFVIGRSHRAARVIAGPVASAAALFAFAAALAPSGAAAHGPAGHDDHDDGPVKERTVRRDGRTLNYVLALPTGRDRPRVGEPAEFRLSLSSPAGGAPDPAADFAVTIVNSEDNEPVFAATLRPGADGVVRFGYQFWDGADHELRVVARTGDAVVALSAKSDEKIGEGEPIAIPIEALEPPTPAVIKSMTLLLAACGLGLAGGFAVGARR